MKLLLIFGVALLATGPILAEEYGNYEEGYNDDMILGLSSEATQIFETCQVDYNALLESSTQMMGSLATGEEGEQQQQVDSAVQQLQQLAQPCSAGQAQVFERALDDFQTCSSIDLRTVLESFADALVGTFLQCTLALAPLSDQIMEDPANLRIPDICIESFMGRNPVGDLVRSYLLYPDKTLPCFSSLSKDLPECTLEAWPIPLIGKLMKQTTCILGNAQSLVDQVATMQMQYLSECLSDDNSCEDHLAACAQGTYTLLLPPPLRGAPLSDAMLRAAQDETNSVVPGTVERYNTFLQECIPDRWVGWSYEMGNYDGSLTYKKQTTEAVDSSSSFVQEPAPHARDGSSSSSSSWSPFLGGLVTGLVLVGGVWAFTLYKKRRTGDGRYQGVEMVTNDLTLA